MKKVCKFFRPAHPGADHFFRELRADDLRAGQSLLGAASNMPHENFSKQDGRKVDEKGDEKDERDGASPAGGEG